MVGQQAMVPAVAPNSTATGGAMQVPAAAPDQAPATTSQPAPEPAAKPDPAEPKQSALDARLAEMTRRMAGASGFDAKNAVFHSYFDKVPESDTATRTAMFATFMTNIPKADADRVARFLEGVKQREQAAAPAPAPATATTTARRKPKPAPAPAPAPAPSAPRPAQRTPRPPQSVLMIGDSLSVGTKAYFNGQLTGAPTSVNATSGISLKEGMRRYDAVAVKPQVVEMGLFTNNVPSQIEDLRAAVQRTINDARARGGKVVWATIKGNPRYGSYDAVNAMLRDFAARNRDVMGLVDWAKMVADHPEYLAGDKIHGTAAGYRARAQAFADAARI